eukprot:519608_1
MSLSRRSMLVLTVFLFNYICYGADQEDLTLYIYNCVSEMTYYNDHTYIGDWEVKPAQTIPMNDAMVFKEYYTNGTAGNYIDANINYYWQPPSHAQFHVWWMVPTFQIGNASMQYDIEPHLQINGTACFENAKQPSYFAVWVYFPNNNTYEECRQKSTQNVKPPC